MVADADSIVDVGVPEGVRDVVGRRLSRLSESTNRVLGAAAVLGREFEFEVLDRMNEPGEDCAWSAIEEGLSNRLVVEGRGRGGPRYAFTHALVQQTLLKELSLPHGRRLHLKAARAIEAVHEHNLAPHESALARHYRSAGAAADPEKAIDYSIRAGSAACAVFAYDEARAHWRGALELMDEQGGGDRKRRADLLHQLGNDLVSSGAEAAENLEAAAPLFEELGDHLTAFDVHLLLTFNLSNGAAVDMRRAMLHLDKGGALLAGQPESLRHAWFYAGMATVCSSTRQVDDGLAAAKRAMEICERLDRPFLRDLYWTVAGLSASTLLICCGSLAEGLHLLDQVRCRADSINDTRLGSSVAWGGGSMNRLLGNFREAQEWCKREQAKPRSAQAAHRRLSLYAHPRRDNVAQQVHDTLVNACIDAGELLTARTYLAETDTTQKPANLLFFEGEWELAGKSLAAESDWWRTTGHRSGELNLALDLARSHRFTGESAQAMQFLQRALQISTEGGDILHELITRSLLATITADAGDAGEALPHLQRCRQILGAGENWFGLAGDVECAEAVVAAAQGKYSLADAHFEKTMTTFQRNGLPWKEADTFQYWGRALLAAGERARTVEKFDAAIEIYRSHGAGTRFIEYVMADKMRAQESKSTLVEGPTPLTGSIHAVAKGVKQEPTDPITRGAPDGSSSKKPRPR